MIYAIVGPTASGKSHLALEIAKRVSGEIINFDAYQVYKQLNIGVAKPSIAEMKVVPHHLFSYVDVDTPFNIYIFQKDLRKKIDELQKQDKNIILVGGSGLYLRAGIYDYEFTENIQNETFSDLSNDFLLKKLSEVDPISASKIHINNRKRMVRALNIALNQKETKSEIEAKQKHERIYDVKIICLNPERTILNEKINNRVDQMFKDGLVDEVNYLFKNYDNRLQSLQAIGYKEFHLGQSDEEIKELIKKNTRNYAKRQMTFFKNQFEDILFVDSIEEGIKILFGESHE